MEENSTETTNIFLIINKNEIYYLDFNRQLKFIKDFNLIKLTYKKRMEYIYNLIEDYISYDKERFFELEVLKTIKMIKDSKEIYLIRNIKDLSKELEYYKFINNKDDDYCFSLFIENISFIFCFFNEKYKDMYFDMDRIEIYSCYEDHIYPNCLGNLYFKSASCSREFIKNVMKRFFILEKEDERKEENVNIYNKFFYDSLDKSIKYFNKFVKG